MRKLGISALVAATLFLAACGGDDESGDDATTSSEETAAAETPGDDATGDAAAEEEGGEAGATGLQAALLAAEDLPEGATVSAFDVAQLSSAGESMAQLLEGVTYEPADCQAYDANPLQKDGAEAAGMTATSGTDVLVNAVYTNASADDVASVQEYYDRCGEITISGEAAGQPLDMTVRTSTVEAPEVDADEVVAVETVTESAAMPAVPTRVIYMIDGDRGVYVAGNPESTTFDLDALAAAALEKLKAQG
ncbi:hypothetical protein E1262_19520 [Jiangella aurantiaca]|uniref:Uncharacterized protein n=1 Tax=Jiangella aurantiaca TaxID=2530373 RepID=A0A4R5A865_9ACTN|nr:DUF5642 family protein [Jiangella aurantiaca]TDD67286.1 hypothetical protein E1262_19520 [Jiangella aurantiaca]